MKHQALIKELEQAGCVFVRHGRRHDLYRNPANGQQAPVPRHREVAETLVAEIRKQLAIGQ
ncbi:MAG: type II toxin-antitoxin system HicA family toxin [Gemmataceae bacterium]